MKVIPVNQDRAYAAIDKFIKWLNDPKRTAAWSDARTGRPPSEFDSRVELFLEWWHGRWGRRFNTPYSESQKYRGYKLEVSDLSGFAMGALQPVIEALVNGETQKLKKLGNAIKRVHKRCSGSGKTFRIKPAKPVKLKAMEIAERGGASAEDIYQAVVRELRDSSVVPTERHLRRIAVDLGIPPANKGGYHTRRP